MIRFSKRMGNAVLVKEEFIPSEVHTFVGKVLPYSNGMPPVTNVFYYPDRIKQTWVRLDTGTRFVDYVEAE